MVLLRWLVMLSIFSFTCWPSMCLLWKNVCSDSLPIFNLGFFFLCWVYEFFVYFGLLPPLTDTLFANIISHSIGGLFILLIVSFAVSIHTHTHTHIHIYMYVCIYVCESFLVQCSLTCLFLFSFLFWGDIFKKITKTDVKKLAARTSLVAQWIRIYLPIKGTQVWSLVQEDSTCRGTTKPASHNYWARVPQLLKPACLDPVLYNKRSHRNEKASHYNEE